MYQSSHLKALGLNFRIMFRLRRDKGDGLSAVFHFDFAHERGSPRSVRDVIQELKYKQSCVRE